MLGWNHDPQPLPKLSMHDTEYVFELSINDLLFYLFIYFILG